MTAATPVLIPLATFFAGIAAGFMWGVLDARRIYKRRFDQFIEELKILR